MYRQQCYDHAYKVKAKPMSVALVCATVLASALIIMFALSSHGPRDAMAWNGWEILYRQSECQGTMLVLDDVSARNPLYGNDWQQMERLEIPLFCGGD